MSYFEERHRIGAELLEKITKCLAYRPGSLDRKFSEHACAVLRTRSQIMISLYFNVVSRQGMRHVTNAGTL